MKFSTINSKNPRKQGNFENDEPPPLTLKKKSNTYRSRVTTFDTIFVMSTSWFLTYLKIKKLEGAF